MSYSIAELAQQLEKDLTEFKTAPKEHADDILVRALATERLLLHHPPRDAAEALALLTVIAERVRTAPDQSDTPDVEMWKLETRLALTMVIDYVQRGGGVTARDLFPSMVKRAFWLGDTDPDQRDQPAPVTREIHTSAAAH
ncbi:MAG: hypothetical protein AB7O57_14820 [Hyphomicrobiaceae bacterium]